MTVDPATAPSAAPPARAPSTSAPRCAAAFDADPAQYAAGVVTGLQGAGDG